MENKRHRLRISELNPHLLCALCGGYLIDATTIVECLHSFCKTCIVRYLETSNYCPICEVLIHKKRPWQNIRLDHTLQNAVYKIVPGLFRNEMQRRRDYYEKHPPPGGKDGFAEQVHAAPERIIFSEDEKFSVTLEFSPNGRPVQEPKNAAVDVSSQQHRDKRFLLCPASLRVGHLKKFVRLKYSLPESYTIDLFYSDEPLDDDYSLMDVAYIYSWRRESVLTLYYSFYEPPSKRRRVAAAATATSQDALPPCVTSARPSTPANPEPGAASSATASSKAVEASGAVSPTDSAGVKTVASPRDLISATTAATDAPATELPNAPAKEFLVVGDDLKGIDNEEDDERPLVICTPEPQSSAAPATLDSAVEAEREAVRNVSARDHPAALHAAASVSENRLSETDGGCDVAKVGVSADAGVAASSPPAANNAPSSLYISAVSSSMASPIVHSTTNSTFRTSTASVPLAETVPEAVAVNFCFSRAADVTKVSAGQKDDPTTTSSGVPSAAPLSPVTSSVTKMTSPRSTTSGASHSARPQSPLGIFDRIYSVTSNCTASGIKSIFKSTTVLPSANPPDRRNSLGGPTGSCNSTVGGGGSATNRNAGKTIVLATERRSSLGVQSSSQASTYGIAQHICSSEHTGRDRRPSATSVLSKSDAFLLGEDRGVSCKPCADSNVDRPPTSLPHAEGFKSEELNSMVCSGSVLGAERRLATDKTSDRSGSSVGDKRATVSSPQKSASTNKRPGATTAASGSSESRTSGNSLSSAEAVGEKKITTGGGCGAAAVFTSGKKRTSVASSPSSPDQDKNSSRAGLTSVQSSDIQPSRPTLASVCRAVTNSVDVRVSLGGGPASVSAHSAGSDGRRSSADAGSKQRCERQSVSTETPVRTCPPLETYSQDAIANSSSNNNSSKTSNGADRRQSSGGNAVSERRSSGSTSSAVGGGRPSDSAAVSAARTDKPRETGVSSSSKKPANGNSSAVVASSRAADRPSGQAASEPLQSAAALSTSPASVSSDAAEGHSGSQNSSTGTSRSPSSSSGKSQGAVVVASSKTPAPEVSASGKSSTPKSSSALPAGERRPSCSSTQNRIFTSKASGGGVGGIKRSYSVTTTTGGTSGSVHRPASSSAAPQSGSAARTQAGAVAAGMAATVSGSTTTFTRISSSSAAATTGASDAKRMKTSGSSPAFSAMSQIIATPVAPTILSSSSPSISSKTSARVSASVDSSGAVKCVGAASTTTTTKSAFSSNVGGFPGVYKRQTSMNQTGPSGARLPAPGTRVDSLLFRATNKALATASAAAAGRQDRGGGSSGRADVCEAHRVFRAETEADSRVSFFDKAFPGGKTSRGTCVSPGVGGSDISFSTRHILSNPFPSYSSGMVKNSSSSAAAAAVANNNNTTTSNKNTAKLAAGAVARNSSVACDLSKKSSATSGSDSSRSNGISRKSEVTTLDIPRLSTSSSRDSAFASDSETSPTPPLKFSDINRNPIKLEQGVNSGGSPAGKACRKDSSATVENGGRHSTGSIGSVGSPSSLGSGPGSPMESERSPARDARRPSDSELLVSQRWHSLSHHHPHAHHLLPTLHARADPVMVAALYNGHFKMPPHAKFLPLVPDHGPSATSSPEPMPLDYSTSSSTNS